MYNMKKERSYWEGTHAANRRIMYLAAGYEQEDIVKKPHIGIANTFFEGSPGTGHLRSLAESVKKGIWQEATAGKPWCRPMWMWPPSGETRSFSTSYRSMSVPLSEPVHPWVRHAPCRFWARR